MLGAKFEFLQNSSELTCPYHAFGIFIFLAFCSRAKSYNLEFQPGQREVMLRTALAKCQVLFLSFTLAALKHGGPGWALGTVDLVLAPFRDVVFSREILPLMCVIIFQVPVLEIAVATSDLKALPASWTWHCFRPMWFTAGHNRRASGERHPRGHAPSIAVLVNFTVWQVLYV